MNVPKGGILIISGTSGAGKSTLTRMLCERHPEYVQSRSTTTRAMRAGERNGVDYDFVSEEEFQRLVDAGEFLEHAGVHSKRYGTRITTVLEAVQAGKTVILAIDVQGRALIQDAGNPRLSGVGITSIFVHVGIEESRRRLNARGDMTAEQIEARMKIAIEELARMNEFDFRVENRSGQIEMAYTVLKSTLGL